MNDNLSVLIIDDHPLFREGLKAIISQSSEFHVVGEAGSGDMGLSLVKKLKPGIVILDITLPDGSGIDIASTIHEQYPSIQIVILTMHKNMDLIMQAFQFGVKAYLLKGSVSDMLVSALKAVAQDDYYLDHSLSSKVIGRIAQAPAQFAEIYDKKYDALTKREKQVMHLLCDGCTPFDIAQELFISHRTVENHKSNLMRKLEVGNMSELVRYGVRIGLINTEIWQSN